MVWLFFYKSLTEIILFFNHIKKYRLSLLRTLLFVWFLFFKKSKVVFRFERFLKYFMWNFFLKIDVKCARKVLKKYFFKNIPFEILYLFLIGTWDHIEKSQQQKVFGPKKSKFNHWRISGWRCCFDCRRWWMEGFCFEFLLTKEVQFL